ncbi:PHP domain-containing protein [Saccharospirillum mangrovi]|uniref:PHP domain-containing protein n=1 Tax=Saccharospirillum mangrovi TaxID=2161747 RepID=UPI000D371B51|nr:PHP domain-containing protein [Saccharospirillum mangrovi]
MNTNLAHDWEMHCHSHASDGVLSPQALYDQALSAGLSHLVLTDHDTAAGYRALHEGGELSEQLRLWPGAELSSLWLSRNIHIVGIGMDVFSDAWLDVERRYVHAREQRFERLMFVLRRAGLDISEADIRAEAGDALPGRPHVARFLVKSGQAKDSAQAFKRWLGTGKVGDVKQGWPPLEQAVADIRACGGKAVLAHPHRYKLTWRKLDQLLDDFQQAGGEAVEVCCPAMQPPMRQRLVERCIERDLLIGGGSDFHQPDTPWARLGWYPQWPSQGKRLVDALLG